MTHESQPVKKAGAELSEAEAAVIMLHGRGATAESILEMADNFKQQKVAYLAPQANNREWYPESFLAPIEQNEPELSSALAKIDEVRDKIEDSGMSSEKTVILGFSQGACLALEYAARNTAKYGGIIGLSGGLIGKDIQEHEGDLKNTEVFLGCSDRDPHIPVERVHETAKEFEELNADVDERIYGGMGHTVNEDELQKISKMIARHI